jgi:acetolactate synthase-1/2/3 large subunit
VNVATAVGQALVRAGVDHVFGVVGSGNFHVTNAMVAEGARFVAARHEGGATTMADACARVSGRVAAVTVHQGCGLTNTMTGLAEAAKSRTPLVVVAAETTESRSNFYVDQPALARAVGALSIRVDRAGDAMDRAVAAVTVAVAQRRTVLLNLPLSVQSQACPDPGPIPRVTAPPPQAISATEVERLAEAVLAADRPVFVAGRGGRPYAAELRAVAARAGALLAESAVAKDLFHDEHWSLGVSGGFASPLAADLIRGADLIVGWGCALNMWTMRHGRLIADGATVVQVDDTEEALGAHRALTFGVRGDVGLTARALAERLPEEREGYRTGVVRDRLAGGRRWRDVAYDDLTGDGRIDPRTLTTALDDLLPRERVVAVDSGNFMGYPTMYLSAPDEQGFCLTQAFQSVGLGLASAIGAALARPDRLPVAALGDGGALMSASELETVARLGLPMLVVVYNDHAYGAEVHHFGPDGAPLDTVVFPDTDLAAIARGYGFEAATVRGVEDLAPVWKWLDGGPTGPMLLDAKVVDAEPSWWLEEAFRGH